MTIPRPLTLEQAVAALGNPYRHLLADGSVSSGWEQDILAWAELPAPLPLAWDQSRIVRRFRCHRLLVPFFESALRRIHASPDAWRTVNDFGGCYAFRANRRDRRKLSLHSWGAAVDLDVCENPQGREPTVHPAVVSSFESEGFVWGGRWFGRARDGMHFEFADLSRLGG